MWLLLIAHLHGWIAGWLYVLLFYGWATSLRPRIRNLDGEPLVLTNEFRQWVVKKRGKGWSWWRWTSTIGRGCLGQPGAFDDPRIVRHEAVHIRQGVDASFKALAIGAFVWWLTGHWDIAWALWGSAWAWQLTNFLTALFRHHRERPPFVGWFKHWFIRIMYYESEHERSAYGQTDPHPQGGCSWVELWGINRK
jgi:hypothetical protein